MCIIELPQFIASRKMTFPDKKIAGRIRRFLYIADIILLLLLFLPVPVQ